MNSGYIYVLANSSMPDLVKVGKTSRDPGERAKELSRVSGVPTPFIVIYDVPVYDCDAAEAFVHTWLTQRGYRVSENREFFAAPAREVVRALEQIPRNLRGDWDTSTVDERGNFDILSEEEPEEMADLTVEPKAPWQSLWEEAEAAYFGLGDTLQDNFEAMNHYLNAARLGCTLAYLRLGDMYLFGEGVRTDYSKAVQFFKEGAKRGNYACYIGLARVFLYESQDENVKKCLSLFLRDRREHLDGKVEEELLPLHRFCGLIPWCISHVQTLSKRDIVTIRMWKSEILSAIEERMECQTDEVEPEVIRAYNVAFRWVKSLPKWTNGE